MKKGIILLASALSFTTLLTSCNSGGGTTQNQKQPEIKLRSAATQNLKVNESMNIVYSVVNSENKKVNFKSEDEKIVTVNQFGEVKAVGTGETDVILSLDSDPNVTAKIHYVITKNFFKKENGFINGNVDLNSQDGENGVAHIKDGQAQVLADFPGTDWYFKTHIDRIGFSEAIGGWGVGSFLVDDSHGIGDTMFWYCLRKHNDDNHARLFYGGWRYDVSVPQSKEELVSEAIIDITEGVDFTIYRQGINHYVTLEYKENGETKVIKHTYEVPLFETYNTYPGVFGQNQKLDVTKYEGSNDPTFVNEKLNNFQVAENVDINALDNRLLKGESYQLTSTVSPSFTINKEIKYSLKENVEGVSLTENGLLTVDPKAKNTKFSVNAVAISNEKAIDTQEYEIIEDTTLETDTYRKSLVIGNPEIKENEIVTNEASYIPFNTKSDEWYLETKINLDKDSKDLSYGIMSSTLGYTHFVKYYLTNGLAKEVDLKVDELNGKNIIVPKGGKGILTGTTNKIGLLKKQKDYYLFVDNKMVKKFESTLEAPTVPVLFSEGKGTFSEIYFTEEVTALNEILAKNEFFVGSYVSKTDGTYVLPAIDLGNATDINWPPVNDYANGLKFKEQLNSNFEIEFNMKDIKPLVLGNGGIDGKVLIYLKSERVTCSLQFVIKEYNGVKKAKFVANLNDASWDEYDFPEGINILDGEHKIKVVRTDEEVQLFVDDVRLFENERFMKNSNYWGRKTFATPGIGTFKCGVTLSNVRISTIE